MGYVTFVNKKPSKFKVQTASQKQCSEFSLPATDLLFHTEHHLSTSEQRREATTAFDFPISSFTSTAIPATLAAEDVQARLEGAFYQVVPPVPQRDEQNFL